ncbi:MAG: 50S ribosomal protein L5, partial [Geminicoccaceae bacterium]|nr:50S ribosomal protein L5 [Geminicoccaceae bacterium]
MARLKEHYDDVVRKALTEKFGYENPMQVPRLDKIVVNMAVGKAVSDSKKLTNAVTELTKIT